MSTLLQQQLIEAQEKVKTIEAEIANEKKQNATSIFDKITGFEDILKIYKPRKEILDIINYNGADPILLAARRSTVIALIAVVLNEGNTDNFWFPVFNTKGSGSVFSHSDNAYYDSAAVGSALRFKDRATSDFAAKTFPAEFKNLLISKK